MSLLLTKSELKELCDTYNFTIDKLCEGQYGSSIKHEQRLMFEHPLLSYQEIIIRFNETYNGCFRVHEFYNRLVYTPAFEEYTLSHINTSVYSFTELKLKINELLKDIQETYIGLKINKKLSELEKDF